MDEEIIHCKFQGNIKEINLDENFETNIIVLKHLKEIIM